ncbi:AAA family ATPase [candidate division KSB1 bacterium]|nr:AAA family ATPase [candidate division KSB1 bacterium]
MSKIEMATIPYNPFTNRSTIMKEGEFVGREAEISNLLSRVRNGDSSSIVGPRRIGKSSLLYHLFLTGNRRLDDADQSKFKFIHIDLQDPAVATVKKFCQHLTQKLGRQLTQIEQQTDELEHLSLLSETLNPTSSHGLPVLLLDEFEKLTEKPERFTDDFFKALRAFANQHKMAIITTSQHTLRELTETQGLTSPLWNLFMVQPVGEFVVSDIVDEVTLFLTHF